MAKIRKRLAIAAARNHAARLVENMAELGTPAEREAAEHASIMKDFAMR